MSTREGAPAVAALFKALGHQARLELLCLLDGADLTVGQLTEASGMSQPLVSQHLRTLRQANLVVGCRNGKEVVYSLADHHVAHVVRDAFTHVTEGDHHD
ncbi:helix-turn-helix transcriptional regulator [Schaalia sp. 19OD2882]|uniref:ArsR/SmtB family transcription factor n=1 Tax=Schaalia sp. 19OD2882 TaxID=2794089 RepID=UPI001C1EF1CD|nr:metalloregulator ArsR/SmtB family transcription factor [Schaalia sp. 19OD2882]QWW18879.1 helix-turn-helix transcriptional regulator [Schaalia sp. 19OD2882]